MMVVVFVAGYALGALSFLLAFYWAFTRAVRRHGPGGAHSAEQAPCQADR